MPQTNLSWRVAGVLALVLAPVFSPRLYAADGQAEKPPSSRFALLVGVQQYAHLGPGEQLDGCRNDVEAMRSLLIERFGFNEDDVQTLVDEQATGEGIRGGLSKLAERIHQMSADSPPADVVFHFSGHGSQLPDQVDDDDRDEEDGYDETLVPFDAQKQGGDEDIRDDELYEFAQNLCGDGRVRLWVVLDCCHSGTGVRGATKIRKLVRSGIAPAPSSSQASVVKKKLPDGAVVLTACRAAEVEPEYEAEGKNYGLLTRVLVEVLHETRSVSDLSYDGLRQAIVSRYQTNPNIIQTPTPQLEGASRAQKQTVLSAGSEVDRPSYWQVSRAGRNRSDAVLEAGSFHGVTAGSLYELYERPEDIVWDPEQGETQEASIGWLRVEDVDGTSAKATLFEWNADRSRQFEVVLPRDFEQGFAVERYHHPGEHGIRVRVVRAQDTDTDGTPLGPDDPQVAKPIQKALTSTKAADETDWIQWVEDDETCDLLLRIDPPYAALFPAAGMSEVIHREASATRGGKIPESLKGGWGPFDLRRPDACQRQLQDYLRRITRARNLIRLASTQKTRGQSDAPVSLDLIAVELDDDYRVTDWEPWSSDDEATRSMQLGDIYALRIRNPPTAEHPLYATVLAIDADMEIQVILPYQAGDQDAQHVGPGESKITDAFRSALPTGSHWTIALATRHPNNFYLLAQPALPKVKGTRSGLVTRTRGGAPSTLEEMLLQQTYFRTRGDDRLRPQPLNDDSWSATILPWKVEE